MDDQDDPEKRIAELERLMAERSPIVELGHQGATLTTAADKSGAPPSSPTAISSTPYGAAAGPASGQLYGMGGADSLQSQGSRPWRRWRLVSIVAMFWLLIPLGHGVSWVLTHLTHHSFSGMNPTTGSPTVSSFRTQPLPDALTVGPGAVVSASGNGQSQTFACDGGTLRLSGNSNTFTVAGHCLKVEVSGNYTHVTVDSADTIDAGGIYTVTVYHWGTPKITESGVGVTVKQG